LAEKYPSPYNIFCIAEQIVRLFLFDRRSYF
jgi:hypothetical protein